MNKKILVVTDMQMIGSGYLNIMVQLMTKLSENYVVIIIGFGYKGEENWWPFTTIPCGDLNDLYAMVNNLCTMEMTSPDAIVVAMDIPQQIMFRDQFAQYKKPYIAITPLENPPLTLSAAAKLMTLDWVFFISELGKVSAQKAGLKNVDHIEIGVDSDFWRKPTPEEKKQFRKGLGIEDDEFIVLTVAENQERKNLWAAMCAFLELKRKGVKARYILVTRVESQYGWNIKDLGMVLGIYKDLITINRGIPLENLWLLYAASDAFLLTSKAEGLGMPILEAMGTGIPVVGTDTGAIHELLEDGRGFLCPSEYSFTDVWMNSKRDMINYTEAANLLYQISQTDTSEMTDKARKFVEAKKWDVPAKQLMDKIEELTNVQK